MIYTDNLHLLTPPDFPGYSHAQDQRAQRRTRRRGLCAANEPHCTSLGLAGLFGVLLFAGGIINLAERRGYLFFLHACLRIGNENIRRALLCVVNCLSEFEFGWCDTCCVPTWHLDHVGFEKQKGKKYQLQT